MPNEYTKVPFSPIPTWTDSGRSPSAIFPRICLEISGNIVIGQNVVYVTGAALDLRATARHFLIRASSWVKRHAVALVQSLLDLSELQLDNLLHALRRGSGKYGMITAAKKRQLKDFVQFRFQSLTNPSGVGAVSSSARQLHEVSVAAFEVRMMMVFLKSIRRPSPSSI